MFEYGYFIFFNQPQRRRGHRGKRFFLIKKGGFLGVIKMSLRYSMIIQWSDQDQCYLVHLPELTTQKYHTHALRGCLKSLN